MPWCAECDRFLSPSTVRGDGTCPSCGQSVEAARASADGPPDEQAVRLPWHLKLLAGAAAVYLGYRAWQGVEWVVQHF